MSHLASTAVGSVGSIAHHHFIRFYKFPHYIETTTFGISCDAFANLKETLTRHKPMVAEYLDKNYDRVRVVAVADFFNITH